MTTTGVNECILVCVYYGPNGERLIRRGGKLASMLECPLYVLTVDSQPEDEWDIEKIHYIAAWKKLSHEQGAEFMIKYNERRPVAKVIAEVANEKKITQVILGQTAQNRWEEITKGSFVNVLLNEIPFVDLHIISVSRELAKPSDQFYEKGIRAYLTKEDEIYKLCFNHTQHAIYEGIFYKEVGTDFNNGLFKFLKDDEMIEVRIKDDYVKDINKRVNV
ncbi:histidine kinase [Paenibacillus septentrionalis]|uniref:Histidine kinase n=1 Tax=Paenibacillus septentrionalis TaxID=429342 RepID=A0ABW1V561_9BACL